MAPFKDILQSNVGWLFKRLAKNIVPLSLVGLLLNYVGNHFLQYAHALTGKRIFYPLHQAQSIQLMGNGDIHTSVLKTECSIELDSAAKPPVYRTVLGKQTIV